MIESRYGHLHDRTEEGCVEIVEFRVEPHRERLKDRLDALAEKVREEARARKEAAAR